MKPVLALLVGMVLQTQLQFDASSVKPNTSGRGPTMVQMPPTGRLNALNATFRTLLRSAYRLQDYQIIGGPAWLDADRFDIQASPPADYQPDPMAMPCLQSNCPLTRTQIMFQELLADRFQLRAHRETRELPVYELTTAKNGFKLKEVTAPPSNPSALPPPPPPPPPPGTPPPTNPSALPTPPPGIMMNFGLGFAGSAMPFSALTSTLTQILGRPIIDKTGIQGYYNFKIVFSRDGLPNSGPLPPPPGVAPGFEATEPVPSIFTAIQEQLGLKLDSAKGPVQVLVIDSVSKPNEN